MSDTERTLFKGGTVVMMDAKAPISLPAMS
jgi:hypothetical protein